MHSRNNSIHAEKPIGECRYELNCTFKEAYIRVAYRDIGKGREQGRGSLAYRDIGKGREQGRGSLAYRDIGKGREQGAEALL
jgi:hypothetical protein